jgi:deoxyribose-phosphate aldolase
MASSTSLTRAEVAAMIDHTLLAPEASRADVDTLIEDARAMGVLAICVSPSMLPVRAPLRRR